MNSNLAATGLTSVPRRVTIFNDTVPGTTQCTGYRCIITVLEECQLLWRVMVHFHHDPAEKVLTFRFPVTEGEVFSDATARLAILIRKHKQLEAMNELEKKLEEYEESIEEDPKHVCH